MANCAEAPFPKKPAHPPREGRTARQPDGASAPNGEASIFPGIVGYDDTVVPQIVNAILSRHNFILLGLRGQAKSRILRRIHHAARSPDALRRRMRDSRQSVRSDLPPLPRLDCRMRREHADRLAHARRPLCRKTRHARRHHRRPDRRHRSHQGRARRTRNLASELTVHYGLLPRANRGIFAINELPDLAGKIQVGLFNIMQEGDVQIKGYPVRLPLDVALVFSANPEDYTARGKIITPLKDRIGSEIRTHYPATVEEGIAITTQEAWTARNGNKLVVPEICARGDRAYRLRGSRRQENRQALGRQPALADFVPWKM